MAKVHLLVDTVDVKKYNVVTEDEILAVKCMSQVIPLCYTPHSGKALVLIAACKQIKMDMPFDDITFIGDFNVHNPGWTCSKQDADPAGVAAQEMSELFGLQQLVNFPTRSEDTLDLVMSANGGIAVQRPGLGTSDHYSYWNSSY